ncbi:hypothetical protein [Bacterioplanoides sp.]|uniref:hypothetical protein n=1 Tax=Bacterioplanoides sp. TaxID=2066072 RepID=UPI003AFFB346
MAEEVQVELEELTELDALKEPESPGGESGDYDPAADMAAEEMAAKEAEQLEQAAQMAADFGIATFCGSVKTFKPHFDVPAEKQSELAKALMPVIKKYGMELPPWLQPYIEELIFLFKFSAVVGVAWSTANRIEREEKAKEEAEDGKKSESVPA